MKSLSHVRLVATPWTAAYQAPPSMGFSRQEYWSGLPLPSPLVSLVRETLLDDLRGQFRPEMLPFLVCTPDYSVHLDWEHIHAGLRVQVMEPDC